MFSFFLACLTCLPLPVPLFLSPFLLPSVPCFLPFSSVTSSLHSFFLSPSFPPSLCLYVSCFLSPFLSYSLLLSPLPVVPSFPLYWILDWLIIRLRIVLCCTESVRRWWTWQTRLTNQTFLMKWNNLENLRKSNCQNSQKRWELVELLNEHCTVCFLCPN